MRSFDQAPDVDPAPGALELRLRHYMARYNDKSHEGIDGHTPRARFEADPRALSFPDDLGDLRARFVVTEERTVSNDHVIQFGGVDYEAPRGLARHRVQVRREVLTGHLSVLHDGRVVRLHPVDLAHNARDRRGLPEPDDLPAGAPPKTAAALAFERDHRPVVGPDGGFTDTE